jgi:hypothetical protein
MTTFFLIIYGLLSTLVMLLLSIALQENLSAGYAWLFGIFVIPISILFGIVMITRSFLAKKYPSELVFASICHLYPTHFICYTSTKRCTRKRPLWYTFFNMWICIIHPRDFKNYSSNTEYYCKSSANY